VDRCRARGGVCLCLESSRVGALGGRLGGSDADADVEFAASNVFGVLDHIVRLPTGEAVYNPMRVIPAGPGGSGCEVVFTLRRRPQVTNDEFEADAAAVAADLEDAARVA
jgi:hypothetical protein